MENKKIICINACLSDNIGDQAISISLHELLLKMNNKVDTYDICKIVNKKDMRTCCNENIQPKLRSFLAKCIAYCQPLLKIGFICSKRYDIAIFGGGQLILNNRMFPLAIFIWSLFLRLFKTKLYFIGCGVGEKFTPLNKFFYKAAFKFTEQIFLRDDRSIDNLHRIFGIKSLFIPDLAFALEFPKPKSQTDKELLIVSIVEYRIHVLYSNEMKIKPLSYNDYIKSWADYIIKNHFKSKILLVNTSYDDIECSKSLYKVLISKKLNVTLIDKHVTLERYIDYLYSADMVISGRMHSLILAKAIGGITIIPWLISKKIVGFVDKYKNIENECLLKNEIKTILARL